MNDLTAGHGIERLFEHMAWADERILTRLASRTLPSIPKAERLFAHVVSAERIWLLRLRGNDTSAQPIWPDFDLDSATRTARENHVGYLGLLSATPDLSAFVPHRDGKGNPHNARIRDILHHVVLHGAYHRGQVAAAMRDVGENPINTDYIVWARSLPEERPLEP